MATCVRAMPCARSLRSAFSLYRRHCRLQWIFAPTPLGTALLHTQPGGVEPWRKRHGPSPLANLDRQRHSHYFHSISCPARAADILLLQPRLLPARHFSAGGDRDDSEAVKNPDPRPDPNPKALSRTQRLRQVIRDYGSVAIVFHTSVSMFSLGTCYLLVSSGLDVERVLAYFNIGTSSVSKGASTVALSYVLHKIFLPLRAGITIVSVPYIVRHLRARGFIKPIKPKQHV